MIVRIVDPEKSFFSKKEVEKILKKHTLSLPQLQSFCEGAILNKSTKEEAIALLDMLYPEGKEEFHYSKDGEGGFDEEPLIPWWMFSAQEDRD